MWALAEAFLWLRDESGDNKSVPVILVYDSEVAKGLTTEPWAPIAHSTLVGLLRDLYVETSDSRSLTWIHVESHGREQDPSKQHLLPLNERADRLAERGRSGDPCLTLGDGSIPLELTSHNWQWNVVGGAAASLFPLGLLAFMRLDVDLGRELSQPLSAGSGRQFAQHFGRAKRLAHEQYCLGSAVANLICRQCGEILVHMNARRLHESFCAKFRPEANGVVYWACLCGFEVGLPPNASRRRVGGIGPPHSISNLFTTRIAEAAALNN